MEADGIRYIIYSSRSDRISIWNFSDLHVNSRACAMDRIREDIQRVKEDKFSFWFGGGDYADCISYTDKRFHPDSISENVMVKDLGNIGKKSMQVVYKLFEPIKDKCLGLLFGNHELEYMKHKEQTDLHGWLCNQLEVRNLGYCAFVDIVFARTKPKRGLNYPVFSMYGIGRDGWRVRFFLHHGAGFATTPGGKLNRLIQFMNNFDADVYMVGHVHDQEGRRQPCLRANSTCTKLVGRDKIGVISGSYLKTYEQGTTTYGEQRAYAPTVLGAARVIIEPDKKKISGEI